jgi:hypothetical protein
MGWTHLICVCAGSFIGSLLATVFLNRRRYRLEQAYLRAMRIRQPGRGRSFSEHE